MTDAPIRFYGRRQGRRLRPGRQRLVDTLLPELRVPPPGTTPLDAATLFPRPVEDLWLEVGFGAGEHLAGQAALHPGVGFIGCEPFLNGVASLLERIERQGLGNVRIWDDDARHLLPALAPASIGRAFVLFSDPWPKKRHHKRRFITAETLDVLARILRDGGELRVASDHMGLIRWTLDLAWRHPAFQWTARGRADWAERPRDGIETRYEEKALARGATCVHLVFRRRPRQP